jgi:hypothetical protein
MEVRFPSSPNHSLEDLHVGVTTPDGASETPGPWIGLFQRAHRQHVSALPWPAANAVVVAAALYIVDPSRPETFSGFAAPVGIIEVIFDESAQHMLVADSLRINAFFSDRHFQWISKPVGGYEARFRGRRRRVLAVEIKQNESELEGEQVAPSVIRLQIEDGTILRWRFRLVRSCMKSHAAAQSVAPRPSSLSRIQ